MKILDCLPFLLSVPVSDNCTISTSETRNTADKVEILLAKLTFEEKIDRRNQYTSRSEITGSLYPFVYELYFSTFKYITLTLDKTETHYHKTIHTTFGRTKTDATFDQKIIQLYIRDSIADAMHPVKKLKNNQKISLVPGETKTLNFVITPKTFLFYNMHYQERTKPHTFQVFVSDCSYSILTTSFELITNIKSNRHATI